VSLSNSFGENELKTNSRRSSLVKNPSTSQLEVSSLNGKRLTACFDEPEVSSDGGLLYLREVDLQVGLSQRLARAIG